MLVLSRKRNETIVIDNNIEVVVVEIRGDRVRLGITAPSDVTVHRREVVAKIEEARRLKEGGAGDGNLPQSNGS
jgi:carbon storage regulator